MAMAASDWGSLVRKKQRWDGHGTVLSAMKAHNLCAMALSALAIGYV
jgi:hypothetical protein